MTEDQIPITLLMASYCQRACDFCSESTTLLDRPYEENMPLLLEEGLDFNIDLFLNELEDVHDIFTGLFIISGGEPMLHPRLRVEDRSYLKTLDEIIPNFEDNIICTNGAWVPLYDGDADLSNPQFRSSVDTVIETVNPLIIQNPMAEDDLKIVRLSLSANPWLALSDTDSAIKKEIFAKAGITANDYLNMLKERDDFYEIVKDPEHPITQIANRSDLKRRIKALLKADEILRERYKIPKEDEKSILYFCIPGYSQDDKRGELNQHAIMDVFGVPSTHALTGYVYDHGRSSLDRGYVHVREDPPSSELGLTLRPGPEGKIIVHADKYSSRNERRENLKRQQQGLPPLFDKAEGIIEKPGDFRKILERTSILAGPNTKYNGAEK